MLQIFYIRTQGQRHVADSLHQNTGPKTCCRYSTSEHRAKDMLQTAYIRTQGQRHAADSQYQRSKTKDMLQTANIREVRPKTCWRHRQLTSETQGQRHVADTLHQSRGPRTYCRYPTSEQRAKDILQIPYIRAEGQGHVADSLHQ